MKWLCILLCMLPGAVFGAAFTTVNSGTDMQDKAIHNELWLSIRERMESIGQSSNAYLNIAAGHDIQSNEYWETMQDWCTTYYTYFYDWTNTPAGQDPVGMTWWSTINKAYDYSDMASGFRRATSYDPDVNDWTDYGDAMFSYGKCQAGDIIGPWLFVDLQNFLGNACTATLRIAAESSGAGALGYISGTNLYYRNGDGASVAIASNEWDNVTVWTNTYNEYTLYEHYWRIYNNPLSGLEVVCHSKKVTPVEYTNLYQVSGRTVDWELWAEWGMGNGELASVTNYYYDWESEMESSPYNDGDIVDQVYTATYIIKIDSGAGASGTEIETKDVGDQIGDSDNPFNMAAAVSVGSGDIVRKGIKLNTPIWLFKWNYTYGSHAD